MSADERVQRVIDGRAWSEFCRQLDAAGESILREGTPASALDRAEGIRYLTRLLRAGLDANLEHGDPRLAGGAAVAILLLFQCNLCVRDPTELLRLLP